jgi:hypothetical protein
MLDCEPVAGLLAVESLEDEKEERNEGGQPGDEAEMVQIKGTHSGSRFKVGQTVLVEPTAFHYATRYENNLFVREECVLAIMTE